MGLMFGNDVRRSVALFFTNKKTNPPDIHGVSPCRFYAGGAVIKLKKG